MSGLSRHPAKVLSVEIRTVGSNPTSSAIKRHRASGRVVEALDCKSSQTSSILVMHSKKAALKRRLFLLF